MSMFRKWETEVRRWWFGERFRLWYHPDYRLPITSLESATKIEPRRADLVTWYLLDEGAIAEEQIRRPRRLTVRDMARVHETTYLESLTSPETLSSIFSVASWDVPVDEVLRTIRLACGGTLAATHDCLNHKGTALNTLGGFHHAFPSRGQRMCPINDIAVAIHSLRAEGWSGEVAILDLDAHPPDGLAACLQGVPGVWIGSLSGFDWGPLDGVDETVLPLDCGPEVYLRALSALLARMPTSALAYVIAGGDVLRGDRSGGLGLGLEDAREREAMVCEALAPTPTVWLPGGGYHRDAWRVLAGAGLYLATHSTAPVGDSAEPMRKYFRSVSEALTPTAFDNELFLSEEELQEGLGLPTPTLHRILDFYTRNDIEMALFRYGLLAFIQRLGYEDLQVRLARTETGDRFQLWGQADEQEWLLIELVMEKMLLVVDDGKDDGGEQGDWWLYVHWLTLRHPRGVFSKGREALPGQEAPGLGLAKESGELLSLIARRLQLKGVALRPSWYHVAYSLRRRFQFADPARHGRFEALIAASRGRSLLEVTRLVADEQVLLNGEPYQWEAELMIFLQRSGQERQSAIDAAREVAHFSYVD